MNCIRPARGPSICPSRHAAPSLHGYEAEATRKRPGKPLLATLTCNPDPLVNVVLDDALLFAVIAETTDELFSDDAQALPDDEAFTTSCWYYRLSRAVAHGNRGALSRPFQELPAAEQDRVLHRLALLPSGIGFVETRRLVPVMAALRSPTSFLNTEAIAAAVFLDAKIVTTTRSQGLNDLAEAVGVEVQVIDPRH